jgi:DNA polymerase-1
MPPTEILALLADQGVALAPDETEGENGVRLVRLRVEAAQPLTTEQRQLIADHRDALLTHLTAAAEDGKEASQSEDGDGEGGNPALSALVPASEGETAEATQTAPADEVPTTAYTLVDNADALAALLPVIAQRQRIAVDTETTGLNIRKDRVRLLQLATERGVFIIDCFHVDPSPLWPVLAGKELVMHNSAFDAAFLASMRLDTSACILRDTMLLSALLTAGDFTKKNSLEAVAERYLNIALDKTHQQADWCGELTLEMLEYAANDALATREVYPLLLGDIDTAGLRAVADLEERCLPAVLWLSGAGVAFDRETWLKLADKAEQEGKELREQLAVLAPPKPGPKKSTKTDGPDWNWNSDKQMKAMFALAGFPLNSTAEEALATVAHPLADLLRRYRAAAKLAGTYGRNWLDYIGADGRIRCTWKQTGAKTGRMASGKPNLQNLPKDTAYRRCFIAPPGRVLVKVDYSQIELRIAAKVSGEQGMIDAFRERADLHTLTARQITGRDDVTSEERGLAKPINFGLIYGLGAPALARKAKVEYGVEMSAEQAQQYCAAWFAAWPGIVQWHNRLNRARWFQMLGKEPAETRTLTGRRTIVKRDLWHGARANFIVQGSGGDGIKAALALLWERRGDCPDAFPVLAVHDEIVVEADEDKAEQAAAWLRAAMIDAMTPILDPVPCEVEPLIAKTWGGNIPEGIVKADGDGIEDAAAKLHATTGGLPCKAEPRIAEVEDEEAVGRSVNSPSSNGSGLKETPISPAHAISTRSEPKATTESRARKASTIPPPLKWHGGKHYLAKRLIDLMPPHLHYVEPFAGGLAVLLAKEPDGVSEVANDLDGRLINFWRVIRNDETFARFQRQVEAIPFSRREWEDAAAVLADSAADPVARAVAFFVRVRQSLAGRGDTFTPLSKTRTRRRMSE